MTVDNECSPLQVTAYDAGESFIAGETTGATRKRVSFQPTTTIVRFHQTVDNGGDRWITTAERAQFVLDARLETKAWIEQGCTFLLQGVFHDTSDVAQEKIIACTQLPGRGYCRGLERYVCREHGLTRDSFQKGALRTIVAEWKKRKGVLSDDECWKEVGDLSRRLTSFAAVFASRVGAADALAARHGEDPSKAKYLLQANFEAVQEMKKQTACPGSPASTATAKVDMDKGSSSVSNGVTITPSKTLLVSRYQLMQKCVANAKDWSGPRESCATSVKFSRADHSSCE